MSERIVMKIGEATVFAKEGQFTDAMPEILIGRTDGPVGAAFANMMAQSKGHTAMFAIRACNQMVRPATITVPKVTLKDSANIDLFGGVVQAGAPIMEIAPVGAQLLVEAKVKPADIGFVRLGLSTLVKLSAYDYYTYGGLQGRIDYISPDALTEEGKAASGDSSYYRALIRTEVSTLKQKDQPLPIIPGMTASVEIRTGEQSVLRYLLKPMLRYNEAFTER